jgi:hypothetical protein
MSNSHTACRTIGCTGKKKNHGYEELTRARLARTHFLRTTWKGQYDLTGPIALSVGCLQGGGTYQSHGRLLEVYVQDATVPFVTFRRFYTTKTRFYPVDLPLVKLICVLISTWAGPREKKQCSPLLFPNRQRCCETEFLSLFYIFLPQFCKNI